MSIEKYSVGVDIDQTGLVTGTDQMIATLTQANEKMKSTMASFADAISSTMGNVAQTMNTVSTDATNKMKTGFTEMSSTISSSMEKAGSSVSSSTSQMSTSLTGMKTSLDGVKGGLTEVGDKSEHVSRSSTQMGEAIRKSAEHTNLLSGMMGTLAKHMEWLVAGSFMGALIGMPVGIINIAESTEVLTQKMRQNLELAPQYHNNAGMLNDDLKTLQKNAETFAVGYGVNLNEVMESMQILSRRFKDVESVSYLTSAAITMNKLDFVDLKKASSDLEAVMLQFGLNAKQTQGFVNDFSVAVHVARIQGTELLDALQRSGSGFKQFNMGSREAIAAISALSTETARTGSTIGNTFKSITANFSMKKAIEALDAYGIKLYDVNEQGLKTMREGANVFQELQTLYGKLDDEGKSKLSLAIAGGKFQVNQMQAFLADAGNNFTNILNEMKSKSSTSMTDQLMAAGMSTFQVKMAQFKASVQVLGKTLGDSLLPTFKNIAVGMTALALTMEKNVGVVKGMLYAVAALAAVYATLKGVALGYAIAEGVVATVTGISDVIFAARTRSVELATKGTWALNLANIAASASTVIMTFATEGLAAGFTALWAAMGPIGWAVLAITALGVAIYEIWNNWGSILPKLQELWNTMVNFVADHIGILIAMFPRLTLVVYLIYTNWDAIVNNIKWLWNSLVNFLKGLIDVIGRILKDVLKAFSGFGGGVVQVVKNIWDRLSKWAYNLLPQWGKDIVDFFANLGSKLDSMTKAIGDKIRENLTVKVTVAEDGSTTAEGGGEKEESPYEKAKRMADEALAGAMGSGGIPEFGGGGGAEMGNQLPEKGGGGRSKKDKESDDEYHTAKRDYEAEIADQELTYEQKIALYKQYLEGKAANEKESTDYLKGLGKLEVADAKEKREIKMALLELEIAEGKERNKEFHQMKIDNLKAEVLETKEGSLERIQAEIKVANAKHELLVQQRTEEAALEDQRKQKSLEALEVQDVVNKQALKMYQLTQEEYDKYLIQSEDTRYRIEKDALEKKKEIYAGDAKEVGKFQTEIDKLTRDHAKSRLSMEQNLFNEQHRYQLAAMEGFRSGLKSSLESINQWNKSASNIIRDFAKTMFDSMANAWIKGVVDNASKSFARMLGLTNKNNSQEVALEQAKQTAITSVTTAGETARLIATKTSTMAATASGAAAAEAMVQTTAAAFTATLAMIQATAASIATIMPMGPAMAAAITAGVATSTATLTAASAAATGTIAGLAVPAYEVGAWEIGREQLAMLHPGETVLPQKPAQQFRDYVAGNDLSGVLGGKQAAASSDSPAEIHLHASSVDPRNLNNLMKGLGKDMVNTLAKQKRNFNTGKSIKGW